MIKGFEQVDEHLWEYQDALHLFKQPDSSGVILKDEDLKFSFTKGEIQTLREYDISYIVFQWGGIFYKTKLDEESLNQKGYLKADFKEIKYTSKTKKNKYVHLGIHSIYELLNGTGSFDSYLKKAAYLQMGTLAICDKNTLAGTLPFQIACAKKGIKSIMGVTYNFTYNVEDTEIDYDIKIYVQNEIGWKNLLKLHYLKNIKSNEGKIFIEEAYKKAEGLIFVLSSTSYLTDKNISKSSALKLAVKDRNNLSIYQQVDPVEFNSAQSDNDHLLALKKYANGFSKIIPPVLIQDSYYIDPEHSKYKLWTNMIGKKSNQHSDDQYFKSFKELSSQIIEFLDEDGELVNGILHQEFFNICVKNNQLISNSCNFSIQTGESKIPKFVSLDGAEAKEIYFRELEIGFKAKVPKGKEKEYRERLEIENKIIVGADFIDYFLILWDLVQFCNDEGIRYGLGRGSVGGCLIAFLLGIIDIDPIEHGLLFERFLNETRVMPEEFILIKTIEKQYEKKQGEEILGKKIDEWKKGDLIDGEKIKSIEVVKRKRKDSLPDVDSDYMATRRHEVKEYLIRRWGEDQVTYIGAYTTMKLKGGLKDYGNVRGLNFKTINEITGQIPTKLKYDWEDIFKFAVDRPILKKFIQDKPDIINCINYTMKQPKAASIHASAIVITPTHDEHGNRMRVWDWMPCRKLYDADTGKTVIVSEWEGGMMDAAGFLKEDILGLKQLDEYTNSIKLIKRYYDDELDLLKIPLDDLATFDLFQRGVCEGVFQFHTHGMKSYCKFVEPDSIEDLVAMNALFRPGPMSSNAHVDFALLKKRKKEPEFDLFMEEVTEDTQGLYIYQEQIMKAMVVGGLSLVESDECRSHIKKFNMIELSKFKDKFIKGYSKLLLKNNDKK